MTRETGKWVRKAEDDLESARALAVLVPPKRDQACFLCQQSADKYLKALLQEFGSVVPRTHNLRDLLDLLLPFDRTLAPLRRGLKTLTRYAVDFRYPGVRATSQRMHAAPRHAERVRTAICSRLGLR
jgi:HEPN domain-containing protein